MKKLLYSMLIILLACALICLDSCSENPPEEPVNPPEEPVNPPEPPVTETVKVSFMYGSETVGSLECEKGKSFDEAGLLAIDALRYEGFGFADWYYDAAFSVPFAEDAVIAEDLTLYGSRGKLAGEKITYDYDAATRTLTLSGEGDMFDFQYDESSPWHNFAGLIKNIVFEGNITSIGSNSFYGFTAIGDVKLPDTVKKIGTAAFFESSITSVNFPESLTDIGKYAFLKCRGLTELCFNASLVNIESGAFYECKGVTSVVMNDEIAFFGNSAFYGCEAIKSAFYMGTAEQYEKITFRLDNFWVKQLTNTFFLSEEKPSAPGPYWHYNEDGEVEKWYYTVSIYASNIAKLPFAFDYVDPTLGISQANLDYLDSLVYHGYKFAGFNIERGVGKYQVGNILTRDIRLTGFRGNICGDNMTWKFSYEEEGKDRIGTLTISGTGRMWDFENGDDAPWVKRNIAKVVITEGVEYIGKNAFNSLMDLKKIEIPVNVTDIHHGAFGGCDNLKYIYYMGEIDNTAMKAKLDALDGILGAVVYYHSPSGESAEGPFWRDITSDGVTDRVAWELKGNKLTVGADSGTMINYLTAADRPWKSISKVTEVEVREGVSTVGHNSFSGMANVSAITIPESVTRISASAFTGTAYYQTESNWDNGALYISNHLIKLDSGKSITEFRLRELTFSIAEGAFDGCSTLKHLVINKDLRGIYSTALAGLSGLERIYYESSESAFNTLLSKNETAFEKIPTQEPKTYNYVYYYSSTRPQVEGNYWRYVVEGGKKVIKLWES